MRRSTRLTTKNTSYATSEDSTEDEIEDTKTRKKSKTSHNNFKNVLNSHTKNQSKQISSQNKQSKKKKTSGDGSSSESDIENYLQPADKIDLNSDFFQIQKSTEETQSFAAIENNIFSGVNKLSDSESENEFEENVTFTVEKTKTNKKSKNKDQKVISMKDSFQQLQNYTKKLEEAKKVVQKYEAKRKIKQGKQKLSLNKQAKEEKLDVSQLLALGEAKADSLTELQNTSQMNGFESHSESEKEDWEEVEEGDNKESKNIIPKDGIQVTVELPGVMRKKKGVDLMASIKRRLNRVRKENQVLVHKVHLLCWIAHGNYINKALNNQIILSMALSLVPSELCPSNKKPVNLKYLEKVVMWYQDAIKNIEKPVSEKISLLELIKLQISSKRTFNKEMLVYIFVCILRSLGIECRLVLSFQVAPLRPPENELHSLRTKGKDKNKKSKKKKSKQDSSEESDKDDTEDVIENDEKQQKRKTQDANLKKDTESNDDVEDVNKKGKNKKERSIGKTDNKIKPANNKDKVKTKDTSSSIINEELKKEKNNESKTPKAIKKNSSKTNDSKVQRKSTRSSTRTIPQLDGIVDTDDESSTDENEEKNSCRKNIKRLSSRTKPLSTYAEPDSDEDFLPENSKSPRKSRANNNNSNKKSSEALKHTKSKLKRNGKTSASTKTNRRSQNQNDDDSDYAPETAHKKQDDSEDEYYETTEVKAKPKPKVKKESSVKVPKSKKGLDVWVEIYLETEERWIGIDVVKGQINCVSELYVSNFFLYFI